MTVLTTLQIILTLLSATLTTLQVILTPLQMLLLWEDLPNLEQANYSQTTIGLCKGHTPMTWKPLFPKPGISIV